MAQRLETVGSTTFRYSPDPAPPAASRFRSIVRARVLDEITREVIAQDIVVTSARKDLIPRVASNAIVGLVARPERVFPALAVTPVDIRLSVASAGYLPLELAGSLGPIAGFPDAFAPLDFGNVLLHRCGVALAGRVVRNTTTTQPIAGATVQAEGIWSNLPPANWTPPAFQEPPNLVALEPGLYAPRTATAAIARRDLVFSAQTKVLLKPLTAGEIRMRVSDRVGLAAGTVLAIEHDNASRIEAIPLAHVDASSSADQPAWLTLALPAKHLHRDGIICTAATPQAPQTPTTLARAGSPGDAVAFIAVPPPFASGVFVEIDDGGSAPEYHRVVRFETTSDASGFFRLPPIARVAFVRLRVQHAGFTDVRPIIAPDYRSAIARITVRME